MSNREDDLLTRPKRPYFFGPRTTVTPIVKINTDALIEVNWNDAKKMNPAGLNSMDQSAPAEKKVKAMTPFMIWAIENGDVVAASSLLEKFPELKRAVVTNYPPLMIKQSLRQIADHHKNNEIAALLPEQLMTKVITAEPTDR